MRMEGGYIKIEWRVRIPAGRVLQQRDASN